MKRLLTLLLLPLCLNAQDATVRTWTNQQGRTVRASLLEVSGVNVVIQLENGTKSTVHLGTLSRADQDYIENQKAAKSASPSGGAAAASGAMTWPKEVFSIDPKTLVVTEGVQDKVGRQFHYQIGQFEFISSAQLAKSVMSEVAADFLLTHQVATQMPWGWEPKPREGTHFKILMAETKDDYVKLFGGNDTTNSTTVNGNSLLQFSVIGLKQVGPRYQFDTKRKDPGGVTFITAYGMFYDLRAMMFHWTRYAYPHVISKFCYQDNGSIRFTDLESSLKKYVKLYTEDYKVEMDLARMIKTMRSKEMRTDATS